MQKKLCLALFLLPFTHTINAADDDADIIPLTQTSDATDDKNTQVARLLILMKKEKENETIKLDEGAYTRYTRTAKRLCRDPHTLCTLACSMKNVSTQQKKEDELVKYIMNQNQKFTINQEGIFTALGAPLALQMIDEFEQDQRKEAKKYLTYRSEIARSTCNEDCVGFFGTLFSGPALDVLSLACLPPPANYTVGPVACCACWVCTACLCIAGNSEN